jgi:hypothetical protein
MRRYRPEVSQTTNGPVGEDAPSERFRELRHNRDLCLGFRERIITSGAVKSF